MTQEQTYKNAWEKSLSELNFTQHNKVVNYNCEICKDDGFTIKKKNGINIITGLCECIIEKDNLNNLLKFIKTIQKVYNIKLVITDEDGKKKYKFPNHDEKRKHQNQVKENMFNEDKGVWLYGVSGFGKTHLIYMAIIKRIIISQKLLKPIVYKAKDLVDLWSDRYGDNDAKLKLKEFERHDIYFINEIEKITITPARETEFFSLFNNFYENINKKIVYIDSQISIDEFVNRMPNDKLEKIKTGVSPMARKLKTICIETHAVRPEQMKL